jgi:hypothetical protein
MRKKIGWSILVVVFWAVSFIHLDYSFESKFVAVAILAFLFEFINGATGMGFGTLSTHAFLWMNFSPTLTIQNILISELFTGLLSSYFHSQDKNIDFLTVKNRTTVTILLIGCLFGVFIGVHAAMKMNKDVLVIFMGVVTVICGLFILHFKNKTRIYHHGKMLGLAIVAAFNKSVTGGGFGALLTSGQIIGGIEGKSASAITSFAKGITGGTGIAVYILQGSILDIKYLMFTLLGSFLAVPAATGFVKKSDEDGVKMIIAVVTIILGVLTTLKGSHIL